MDRRTFLATGTLLTTTGCLTTGQSIPTLDHTTHNWSSYTTDWPSPTTPPTTNVDTTPIIEGLKIPWDLGVAPNGDLFITERTGRLRRFNTNTATTVLTPPNAINATAIPATPNDTDYWETWFLPGGEGGVLGVAPHPEYPDPPWVFIYYTATTQSGKENRVVRYDLTDRNPTATATPIITDIPADAVHNGGRLAWGPNNYLWVTTGDAGTPAHAQDGQSLAGKVLRVDATGTPAHDNPTKPTWDPRIFTIGHRNPQGLTWLPNGAPIITEHGPSGHDECSLLLAGHNYGWPTARTPTEYSDTTYTTPLFSTGAPPAWAPAGAVYYTGDAIPSWQHRLIFGQLFGQRLGIATITPPNRNPPPGGDHTFDAAWLHGDYTVTVTHVLPELGRIRGAFQGQDGALYAITSNRDGRAKGDHLPHPTDDRVVKITAA